MGMFLAEFGLIQVQVDQYLNKLAHESSNRRRDEEVSLLPSEQDESKATLSQQQISASEEEARFFEEGPVLPYEPISELPIERISLPSWPPQRLSHRWLKTARLIVKILVSIFCILNMLFGLWVFGWPEMWPEQVPGWGG